MLFPISFVIAGAVALCVRLWLLQRQQAEAQKTVRLSLEKGVVLTPELLLSMGVRPFPTDLRRGAVLLCIAVGCVIYGVLDAIEDRGAGGEGSLLTFLAIAVFPALIGTTFIAFYLMDRRGR